MAMTNQERVGKAIDLLRTGLAPFVEREVQPAVKAGTVRMDRHCQTNFSCRLWLW